MIRVRVIGIGTRTPFGVGTDALIKGLCEARAVFAPYSPFARAGLKHPIAAAVTDETLHQGALVTRDRGALLLEGAIRDAIEQATGVPDVQSLSATVAPERIAVVAGTSSSGIGAFCCAQATDQPRAEDDARYASATHAVAKALGVVGPVHVITSVCASGALAIAEAAQMLDDRSVDVAIAAGFDPLEPFVGAGFDSLNALTDVPRPFRAERRGLVLGEGSAALVMVREDAFPSRRSVGWVCGWGESADAHHLTAPDPTGNGVALAIRRALASASLIDAHIDVVNAHGTGTPFNDAMESAALVRVFGPRASEKPVYTVKGTIGHTLGAAGAIEAAVSIAAMNAGVIPPTVTSGADDPRCAVNLVAGRAIDARTRYTLSLSSAFGGTNCALVLERGDAEAAS